VITESEAKRRAQEVTKDVATSCAYMDGGYVFTFLKDPYLFKFVDSEKGEVYNFTPGLDLLGFNTARRKVYIRL